MKLSGRNTLITGGSQGLGRVIVEAFLAEGANVVFCARTAADVARTLMMLSLSELPDSVPLLAKRIFNIVRRVMKNAYIKEYTMLSHMAPDAIAAWELPLAAARLNERRPERETKRLYELIISGLKAERMAEAYAD